MALINTTTTGVLGTTVFGDGQGALTVQQDGVTINKIVNAPLFGAYSSTTQTISNNTWTKVNLQSIYFNVGNAFDNTTNYRFQPTIAGYYLLNGTVQCQIFTAIAVGIWKNGAGLEYAVATGTSGQLYSTVSTSKILYLNGTTDYAELYVYQASGGSATAIAVDNVLYGSLVKAA